MGLNQVAVPVEGVHRVKGEAVGAGHLVDGSAASVFHPGLYNSDRTGSRCGNSPGEAPSQECLCLCKPLRCINSRPCTQHGMFLSSSAGCATLHAGHRLRAGSKTYTCISPARLRAHVHAGNAFLQALQHAHLQAQPHTEPPDGGPCAVP